MFEAEKEKEKERGKCMDFIQVLDDFEDYRVNERQMTRVF